MRRLIGIASLVAVLLAGGIVMAWGQEEAAQGTPARLLVAFPDDCNTPDGMSLQPDNSIIVSLPNFNDEKSPPRLMRVTPDNKAEVFYMFPTPYPGLQAPVDRIAPMGISRAPSGDLYLADMQYMKDKNQKSRMWRLVVKDGRVDKMVLVASGFNVANGTAIHGDYVYITESVLEEGFNPTMKSAVLRFKLDEENVTLKTPLRDDPHVITTFESHKQDWALRGRRHRLRQQGQPLRRTVRRRQDVQDRVGFRRQREVEQALCRGAVHEDLRRHVVRRADRQAVPGRFGRQCHPGGQPGRIGRQR